MHVRRVGNNYMKNFFADGNLFFSLLEHKRPLSLVCKIQTMSGSPASSWPPVLENVSAQTSSWLVPRYSAHPLGSGCDRFCSALCRSSRCDALPGGSRLLSVPGDSGADSYTSQSKRGALPGTYTHVKKAPGFIRLSPLHSAISRFCVYGHWNGYAGAISNAKYHQVTQNLFSQILIFLFWNQNCLRIQELQKNHRSYSSAASK